MILVSSVRAAMTALSMLAIAGAIGSSQAADVDQLFRDAVAASDVGDHANARTLYGQSCAAGHAPSCTNLGSLQANGQGGSADAVSARRLFERACSANHTTGCTNLAIMLAGGAGGQADPARARTLYEAACAAKNATACFNLGVMLHNGDGGNKDPAKAADYFKSACDHGIEDGCKAVLARLGSLYKEKATLEAERDAARQDLAVLHRQYEESAAKIKKLEEKEARLRRELAAYENAQKAKGALDAKDYDTARKLAEASCTPEFNDGCRTLAIIYDDGKGVAPDAKRAAELYDDSCRRGDDPRSCALIGLMLKNGDRIPADLPRARALFIQACDEQLPVACDLAATMLRDGEGGVRDLTAARTMFKAACDGNYEDSCTLLAFMTLKGEGGPASDQEAMEIFGNGCALGSRRSCHALGDAHREGVLAAKDSVKARYYYGRACDLGLPDGCDSFAEMQLAGDGGPQSKAGAKLYFERACKLGSQPSCQNLATLKAPETSTAAGGAATDPIAGIYTAEGITSNGIKYSSVYIIKKISATTYEFTWREGPQHGTGRGTITNGKVNVDYGDGTTTIYTLNSDGTLVTLFGENDAGKEVLTRKILPKESDYIVIAGRYRGRGINPKGKEYSGSMDVSRQGDGSWLFVWTETGRQDKGIGWFRDGVIVVDFGGPQRMFYVLNPNGTILGTWGETWKTEGWGTETLVPKDSTNRTAKTSDQSADPNGIAGIYAQSGFMPNGTKFSGGTYVVEHLGNGVYRFNFDDGRDTAVGKGTLKDGRIKVSFKYNIMDYQVNPDGTLTANWGQDGKGFETLTPQ